MREKVDKGLYSSYKSYERDYGITLNAISISGKRGEKITERYGDDGATSLISISNFSYS